MQIKSLEPITRDELPSPGDRIVAMNSHNVVEVPWMVQSLNSSCDGGIITLARPDMRLSGEGRVVITLEQLDLEVGELLRSTNPRWCKLE